MKELTLKAMAKVNLGLDVLRKREDGYHDLRMVMQSVYLYDKIRMHSQGGAGDSAEDEPAVFADRCR